MPDAGRALTTRDVEPHLHSRSSKKENDGIHPKLGARPPPSAVHAPLADDPQRCRHDRRTRRLARIHLAGGLGTGEPRVDENGTYLNGFTARHEAGDTFLFDPEPWKRWDEAAASRKRSDRLWARHEQERFARLGWVSAFCKTKRRPYDAVVCAILLRARYLAPDAVFVGGDGRWQAEWRNGAASPDGPADSIPSARWILEELFGQRQRLNPLGFRHSIAERRRRG